MAYKEQTITIDLGKSAPALTGRSVTIKNPALVSWDEEKQIDAARDAGGAVPAVEQVLRTVVKAWNLEDPETGETLPVADSGFARAPGIVISAILAEYRNVLQAAGAVPKETETE